MVRSFLAKARFPVGFRVALQNARKQGAVAVRLAQEPVPQPLEIQAQPSDALGGKILLDQALAIFRIAQVAKCAPALVDVAIKSRLATDGERWVPIEQVTQQGCAAARRTHDKNRRLPLHCDG